MIEYLYGAATMYALGAILMLNVTDPADSERPNAHIWFSLGWPVAAIISIYEMLRYGSREDE
jgi:hypothetical protein